MNLRAMPWVGFAATALTVLLVPAHAASISLVPVQASGAPGTTVSFDLVMNFAANEPTLGGGIDIDLVDLTGGISLGSFTPSTWFNSGATNPSAPDPAFSGHGTLRADADYEVHIGNFNGMSGNHVLGSLTINLVSEGTAELRLAPNTFWGNFFTASGQPQMVTMTGATVTVVPEPSTALMALLGIGALAGLARRRLTQAQP